MWFFKLSYTHINNVQILNCQSNLIMHMSVFSFFQIISISVFFNFPWPSLSESHAYCFSCLWSTCIYVFLYTADWLYPPIQIALVCNGSSLHAQVEIRSRGNASNVINDADDDFLISQIISQDMLATVWVCFDPHPHPAAKARRTQRTYVNHSVVYCYLC